MVLHAPIGSGVRVIMPEMVKTMKRDLFPNIDYIKYVNTPVFIIHGEKDEDVGKYYIIVTIINNFIKLNNIL